MIGGANYTPPNIGCRSETRGANVSGQTNGTTLTANAAANTKGVWANIGSTTSFRYKRLCVQLAQNSAAVDFIVDIGIDVGGQSFIIAEDLRFATARRIATEQNQIYDLPLEIVAGAQLTARVAASTGGATCQIVLQGFSNGIGGTPGFSRCRALYTPSSSRGPAIDPGASANTKGAYTQLVASSGFGANALMFMIGFNNDIARAAGRAAQDIAIGASGSEQVIHQNFIFQWDTSQDGPHLIGGVLLPLAVPAATRIAARGQSSQNAAGDRTWDLALWGFAP